MRKDIGKRLGKKKPARTKMVFAVPSSINPAGIAVTPVKNSMVTNRGFRPHLSNTKMQKMYEGTSINAAKMEDTKILLPKLVALILMP